MKKNIGIVLLCVLLYSCEQKGRPPRKKIPDLSSLDGTVPVFKGAAAGNGLPFYTDDIALLEAGNLNNYLYVALPDAVNDSLTLNLVNSYKPLAIPLLTRWAQQEKKGVMIDLRSSSYGTLKSQFVIEKTNAFSIPVIFLWDHSSAGRAAEFMTLLQSMPAVTIKNTDAHGITGFGRQNCF